MKEGGQLLAGILRTLLKRCQPGTNAADLNKEAEKLLRETGGEPAFKGYQGYPSSICVSVNSEVVHGQPTAAKVFREGDLVSIDIGLKYKGFVTDTARSIGIGQINVETQELIRVTRAALDRGIAQARVGQRIGGISSAIQKYVESHGFGVVRSLVGHGVGRAMHEDPRVPNYGSSGTGLTIESGLTLAIEPMVTAGSFNVMTKDDGWTVLTSDGRFSAHFEDSIAITDKGVSILTR